MLNAMQIMKAMLALTCVIFKENNCVGGIRSPPSNDVDL